MPKKSRRAKAKHRIRLTEGAQQGTPRQPGRPAIVSTAHTEVAAVSTEARQGAEGTAERYRYVTGEVKKIGILAGSILLVIIILSFILG